MGGIFGGGKQTQTSNSTSNSGGSYSNTSTPNIPDWWLERYNGIDSGLDAAGRTVNQGAAADFLRSTLGNNALGGAYGAADQATADALGAAGRFGGYIDSGVGAINRSADAARASSGAIGDAMSYLQNQQNNGSFTLGRWFPDAVNAGGGQASGATAANVTAAGAPAVAAGTGVGFMGAYATPLSGDYVNASLADYDAGAAKGFNALRAANADAFGNKRTGVAEGQFMADAARGRGTLSSDLRLNAFNTAAGLGQQDASRALAADTTNAGNTLNTNQFNAANALQNNQFNAGNALATSQFNARQAQDNNQFNANLTDSRQKFDVGQAETGEQRRLGVANDFIGAAQAQANVNATAGNIAAQGVNAASAGVNAAAQRAGLGAQGLDNAINLNGANLANANALGNFDNMTLGQLYQMLNLGQAGIGKTDTGNSSSTTSSSGTQTAAKSGSPLDVLGKIAMIAGM